MVQHLSTKMASAISDIKQANFLPKKSLVTLYQSLGESRLRYCNTVWGNCGETLKKQASKVARQGFPGCHKNQIRFNRAGCLASETRMAKCSAAH